MKKKIVTAIILILLTILITNAMFSINLSPSTTQIEYYVQDQGNIEVYFCPHQNCEENLTAFIASAEKSIHCALFDIGLESVQNVLLEKSEVMEVQIVTDDHYIKKFNHPFVKEDTWGLQHNKFCIIDGTKITTGSMNPTNNGAHKNNNNLLFIESPILAANYEAEFQEMWNGTFKKGNPVKNTHIRIGKTKIKNYFCPDDNCAYHVKEELRKARKSIHFMLFSFTHKGIQNILLLKNLDGVPIQGVMEARQVSKYSTFEKLAYQDVDVHKDGNKQNMHHKVWIIDRKTVITGSMNPSAGGDRRNDENVLVIEDPFIVSKYLEEFERVYGDS